VTFALAWTLTLIQPGLEKRLLATISKSFDELYNEMEAFVTLINQTLGQQLISLLQPYCARDPRPIKGLAWPITARARRRGPRRTVIRLENGAEQSTDRTLKKLRTALEQRGVTFVFEDGKGVGIRGEPNAGHRDDQ
jgi:hypothetical protein